MIRYIGILFLAYAVNENSLAAEEQICSRMFSRLRGQLTSNFILAPLVDLRDTTGLTRTIMQSFQPVYIGSNAKPWMRTVRRDLDEIDAQLWELSKRHNPPIEIGVYEVIDKAGRIVGISKFYFGSRHAVQMDRAAGLALVKSVVDAGIPSSDLKIFRTRHLHPNFGFGFSGLDYQHAILDLEAVTNLYGPQIEVETSILYQSLAQAPLGRVSQKTVRLKIEDYLNQ